MADAGRLFVVARCAEGDSETLRHCLEGSRHHDFSDRGADAENRRADPRRIPDIRLRTVFRLRITCNPRGRLRMSQRGIAQAPENTEGEVPWRVCRGETRLMRTLHHCRVPHPLAH